MPTPDTFSQRKRQKPPSLSCRARWFKIMPGLK